MRTLIVLKEYFIRTLSGMVWEQQFEVVAGRHDPIHSADPFGPAGNQHLDCCQSLHSFTAACVEVDYRMT